ncbi:MAG: adenylate/guanylate cyclase domain-containing protein [Deltaproteobacteria bacterium]|nr:adenylate/guanylate cyclase domain-containing protein [Deltaproteobacteria bacterium]
MERKLTAILSADVKGYSRLMGADEEGTLRILNAYRKVMDALIAQHRGRVVGSAGDSVLAEFASVVDAVQCALVIQATLKAENASLPLDRRMEFRIGINLGDVMVDGEQIYGDGVNIAARLESLADPGGIYLSGTVHEHIKNKLALAYEDLGEQQVKNIAEPVRVWRVVLESVAAAGHKVPSPLAGEGQGEGASGRAGTVTPPHPDLPPQGGKEPKNRRLGTAHRVWLVVGGLVLSVAVIVAVRYLSRPPLSTQDSALRTDATPAALPLPDKPSIVVLPFVNMSGDPEQEYFTDGITEDLTTDLSKVSGLFVIARNSAFIYKGQAVDVGEVSRKLGVQYVLEGSVRKADNQVRITAQLVDATTGYHVWSERYDREMRVLFALQDEIRQKIMTALKVKLTKEEQERFKRAPTDNLEAYDYLLRGGEYWRRFTKEAHAQARQMFEKAVELDPQYAAAYASLGAIYWWEWAVQWSQDPQTLEQAFKLAQKAVALDDSLPVARAILSQVYQWKKQHEQAIAEAERAVVLAPNSALCYATLGQILNLAGRPAEAVGLMEKAVRLDPQTFVYLDQLGRAYRLTGRYEEAIATLNKGISVNPNRPGSHAELAVIYSELGREQEARAEVAEILRISPNFSVESLRQRLPYKDPADLERFLDGLRKAGLK